MNVRPRTRYRYERASRHEHMSVPYVRTYAPRTNRVRTRPDSIPPARVAYALDRRTSGRFRTRPRQRPYRRMVVRVGSIERMASDKVTLSLDTDVLTRAREAASASGVSLSAYVATATRTQLRADGARALAEFMASPDAAELDEWTRATTAARLALFDADEAA